METVTFPSRDTTPLVGIFVTAVNADTAVVLAHGITAEKEEDGFYTGLASRLAVAGVESLRFDFRGHGDSGGAPVDMTVAGEAKDLSAAVERLRQRTGAARIGVVAASFGAAAAARYLADEHPAVAFLVLLNPVLDMQRTFVRPELPWAQASFTPEAVANVNTTGHVLIDGAFPAGASLVAEMDDGPQPCDLLTALDLPMLVIHGSEDTYVSYDIAREFSDGRPGTKFVSINGAEHGFGRQHEADAVYDEVVSWIKHIAAK